MSHIYKGMFMPSTCSRWDKPPIVDKFTHHRLKFWRLVYDEVTLVLPRIGGQSTESSSRHNIVKRETF